MAIRVNAIALAVACVLHLVTGDGVMVRPNYDSGWIDIVSQTGSSSAQSIRYFSHGLGEIPLLVDVQVKAVDGPNQGYIFQATGHQFRDDDQPEGYGVVVYYYDATHVNVTAPTDGNNYLGRCIYTSASPYWEGPGNQDSYTAQVRVRAWKASSLPPPDFSATGITIRAASGTSADSYVSRSHNLGSMPSLVISRTMVKPGMYVDSVGATHAVYSSMTWQLNGYVVYGFNAQSIRVWAPSDSKGRLYAGGDGFGLGGSSTEGQLELYAWTESSLTSNATHSKSLSLSQSGSSKNVALTNVGAENIVFTRSWVEASGSGSNSGFRFVGTGSLAYDTAAMSQPCTYGGLVYAYTTTHARFWQPGNGNGASNGALICLSSLLAQGTNNQATHSGTAYVKQWELDYDDCIPAPCQNGGTCTNYRWGYTCQCAPGWTGKDCDVNINECASNPCLNSATCNDLVNGYTCTCSGGWTGTHCDVDIDECTSTPCQNAGTCNNLQNQYTCTCASGWTGTNCATDVDECSSTPCQNAGTCNNLQNQYTCTCASGWTGTNCDTDIDECTSTPCQNAGTCNNLQNQYTCTCAPGWTGTNCDTDIDECSNSPCQNAGTCNNLQNQYTCTCASGWTGTNCDVDIDECTSNPCQNGGSCSDQVNGYTCACTSDYQGTHCESVYGSAVDGAWGDWQAWQGCSVTCSTGVQRRYRACDNPSPFFGGAPCPGNNYEENACSTGTACPASVDGQWSAWASTGGCSVTCGDGQEVKIRTCDNPVPSNGGRQCAGDALVISTCNMTACPNATGGYVNRCPNGFFTCSAGSVTCIQNMFRCDCLSDCDDGSDETVTWAGCAALCSSVTGLHDVPAVMALVKLFALLTVMLALR